MISCILSRLVILVIGTLYPAYASYKVVKSRNPREYVKWMMYWIVFAFFTCVETITDIFLSWFPFYYEGKILIVIWLLSPMTRGSSFLYRKFVHPMLSTREQEIDEYLAKAKEQGYKQVLDLGSKGVNVLMQTALKSGGGLVNQIKKSYSLSDLAPKDDIDSLPHPHVTSTSVYFSELDVRSASMLSVKSVTSSDDISSGYSSTDNLIPKPAETSTAVTRTGSIRQRAQPTRVTRSGSVKRTNNNEEMMTTSMTLPRTKRTTKKKTL